MSNWVYCCLAMLDLCLVKFKGCIFIGKFIPKQVLKQISMIYSAVCVPVMNLSHNLFLIYSVF